MIGCGKACSLGPGIRGLFRCGAFPHRRLCPACAAAPAAAATITCKTCDKPDKPWNDAHAGFCASCVEAGWEAYKRGFAEASGAAHETGLLTVRDLVSVLFVTLAGAGKVWLLGYSHTIGFETKEGAEPYMGLVLRDKAGVEIARGTIPDVLTVAKQKGAL